MSALLEATRITKRYGATTALHDASIDLRAGEVLCLLGGNGAGKSTLIRILSGAAAPTSGELRLDGRTVVFDTPRAAREAGIATVPQDLALVPLMSVWRNFVLGAEPTHGRGVFRRIDAAHARASALREIASLGVDLPDADVAVEQLSGGQRQAVSVARALHFGARVLIMDEPIAALGARQAGIVLESLARASARGIAVLLVTHNPQHAFVAGDRFVLLRRGEIIERGERADMTLGRITEWMTHE